MNNTTNLTSRTAKFLATALFLLVTLATIAGAAAQAPAPPAARPTGTAAAESESSAVPNDASHQGIKVHGHWTITVRNADGSAARTTEFENSLTSDGAQLISKLLLGTTVRAYFMLSVFNGSGIEPNKSPCQNLSIPSYSCNIYPSAAVSTPCIAGACAIGLTATATPTGFTLRGSILSNSTGSITHVTSYLFTCPQTSDTGSTVTAAACYASTVGTNNFQNAEGLGFTDTTTPSPIPVTADQTIDVRVAITFS